MERSENRLWNKIYEIAVLQTEKQLSHITLIETLAQYKNSSILERAGLCAACEIWISNELDYRCTDLERMLRAIYVMEYLEAPNVEKLMYYKKMAIRNLNSDPEPIYD